MNDEIAISKIVVGEEEERLVLAVLRSGHLAQGPMVERLEAAFAAMCGVPARDRREQRDLGVGRGAPGRRAATG